MSYGRRYLDTSNVGVDVLLCCLFSLSVQVAQLGELGLMGVAIGETDGGTGLDYLVLSLIHI